MTTYWSRHDKYWNDAFKDKPTYMPYCDIGRIYGLTEDEVAKIVKHLELRKRKTGNACCVNLTPYPIYVIIKHRWKGQQLWT